MEDFDKDLENSYPFMTINEQNEYFSSAMRSEAMLRVMFLRTAKNEARRKCRTWFGLPVTSYRRVYRQMVTEANHQLDKMLREMKKYPIS